MDVVTIITSTVVLQNIFYAEVSLRTDQIGPTNVGKYSSVQKSFSMSVK